MPWQPLLIERPSSGREAAEGGMAAAHHHHDLSLSIFLTPSKQSSSPASTLSLCKPDVTDHCLQRFYFSLANKSVIRKIIFQVLFYSSSLNCALIILSASVDLFFFLCLPAFIAGYLSVLLFLPTPYTSKRLNVRTKHKVKRSQIQFLPHCYHVLVSDGQERPKECSSQTFTHFHHETDSK